MNFCINFSLFRDDLTQTIHKIVSLNFWKVFHGHYFIRDKATLSRGWKLLRQSHNKFSFMILYIFHDVLKVESKWFFAVLVAFCLNYWQPLSALPVILTKWCSGIPNRFPNWTPHLGTQHFQLTQRTFSAWLQTICDIS